VVQTLNHQLAFVLDKGSNLVRTNPTEMEASVKHFQEFSHLCGAEYLAVRKLSIYREIISMLAECHRSTLMERRVQSNSKSFEIFSEKFSEGALQRAWRETSAGLEKERVALRILTPASFLENIISNWLWNYSVDNIDVGVGIVPISIARRRHRNNIDKENPTDNFNEVVKEIKRPGRNIPIVPFLLVAVPLQA